MARHYSKGANRGAGGFGANRLDNLPGDQWPTSLRRKGRKGGGRKTPPQPADDIAALQQIVDLDANHKFRDIAASMLRQRKADGHLTSNQAEAANNMRNALALPRHEFVLQPQAPFKVRDWDAY